MHRRCIGVFAVMCVSLAATAEDPEAPHALTRHTFAYEGVEREYFVGLPNDFDSAKTYWMLLVAHGGGSDGQSFWLTADLVREVEAAGLDAIVVSPSFLKTDPNAEQFPLLGGGDYVERLIDEVGNQFSVHEKMLVTGYSRGGQFAHRFALYYPQHVRACAPISAGSWTTPDGRFLMYGVGEVADAEGFLGDATNSAELAPAQQKLFNAAVGEAAHRLADPASKEIPFLVMCGALDERYEISQAFAASLENLGYFVETAWPRTAHGGRSTEELRAEFAKYGQNVVAFFLRQTADQ